MTVLVLVLVAMRVAMLIVVMNVTRRAAVCVPFAAVLMMVVIVFM